MFFFTKEIAKNRFLFSFDIKLISSANLFCKQDTCCIISLSIYELRERVPLSQCVSVTTTLNLTKWRENTWTAVIYTSNNFPWTTFNYDHNKQLKMICEVEILKNIFFSNRQDCFVIYHDLLFITLEKLS